MSQDEYAAVVAGFQRTVFPIIAGAVGKFPPIDVKLNGVTANTKPSRPRYSDLFQAAGVDRGCESLIAL